MKIQTIEKLFNKKALIEREISDLTAETILEMLRNKRAYTPTDPAVGYFTIQCKIGTLDERLKSYVDCAITSLQSANKVRKTTHRTTGSRFYYLREEKK